jgi:RNA polymerase sigma-70 factor (ECF subfamily)
VSFSLCEAEDAVQEAYTRAWQRWTSLRDYADAEAWVRTVAFRVAVSSWRKAVNRLAAHHRHGAPAEVPDLDPEHVTLVSALRKLPLDQRRALVLRHVVGLTVDDIAHETSVAAGTVKIEAVPRPAGARRRDRTVHSGSGGGQRWLSRT